MNSQLIKTLFLDIGGVLLNDGWGHETRNKTLAHFKLDSDEINKRFGLTLNSYEEGKLTLPEYLKLVVFYETRNFSEEDFAVFMFKQSIAYQDAIDFFKEIKKRYHLKVIALSNEGREMNAYRVEEFKLNELFDAFISSSFVHTRKPDADIFHMACDISQTVPEHSLFIDDTLMFVEIAQTLGINGMHYQGLDITKNKLKTFGLSLE